MTDEQLAYVKAARCPQGMKNAESGVWTIVRLPASTLTKDRVHPYQDYMLLARVTLATVHQPPTHPFGDVVMEDTPPELLTHFPFWRDAHGSVLISGLGLGCIARAVLAKACVSHVTVLEIDPFIVGHVGAEFAGNQKIRILQADARTWEADRKFDCAWHDIYTEDGNGLPLAKLHTEIMVRFEKQKVVKKQGAWNYPVQIARRCGFKWGRDWSCKPAVPA